MKIQNYDVVCTGIYNRKGNVKNASHVLYSIKNILKNQLGEYQE